jgi:glycosyltransferase involved in cell wall biosynthesis
MKNHKKVAMVQYVLVHYREPIFYLMCKQSDEYELTFFSDSTNTYGTVKTIDSAKAELAVEKGGLRWRFIKNRYYHNWCWQSGVLRLSLGREFDTIIYEGSVYYLSTWIGALLAKMTGKRVLMWGHGFLRDERGSKSWIRKTFYRLADGHLLYHNRAKEILVKKGFKPENLYVVYNSLDYDAQIKIRSQISKEDIASCRQKLFKNPDRPILLFIGRLTPQKKLGMMIEAAKLLKDRGRECNILFVGDGPASEELQKLAKQVNLDDNVCMYGACYEEKEIARLISASDICVAPGEVGLTCMHSLVYGKPVITHDNPDFQGPEYEAITPGYNGAFFKKDDVQDLANTIERWLQENKDPSVVASRCHEVIDQYYNPHYQINVVNAAVNAERYK